MDALIIDQSKLPKLKYRRYPHGGVLSPTATDLYLFITFFCTQRWVLFKKNSEQKNNYYHTFTIKTFNSV